MRVRDTGFYIIRHHRFGHATKEGKGTLMGPEPIRQALRQSGFGNRDGKEGFGSDTSGGATAVGVNENADDMAPPRDNMRSEDEGRPDRPNQDMPAEDEYTNIIEPSGRPVDELDAHDRRPGVDEMLNPNSRVGMGQMDPKPIKPITGTDTNAELNDYDASDTAISQ